MADNIKTLRFNDDVGGMTCNVVGNGNTDGTRSYMIEIFTEHENGRTTGDLFELNREQAVKLAFHLAQFIADTSPVK